MVFIGLNHALPQKDGFLHPGVGFMALLVRISIILGASFQALAMAMRTTGQ
jgi:hypothetical protein